MSLIKCPKCGEMFSDSYKTCPFCEEDEAYYGGRVKKTRGRRTAENRKRRAPSILGPVVVIVLGLLADLRRSDQADLHRGQAAGGGHTAQSRQHHRQAR